MIHAFFKHKYSQYTFLSLCLVYVLILQFYHLNELPIIQWDESRLAVNAAEMFHSGDFLTTTYEYKPDCYNTKPPLMIWLQVLSASFFGMNEMAIRFPSALAGFFCILFCGWIIHKHTDNINLAALSILILASTGGFIQLHGSLTGDFDALLAALLLMSFYYHQDFIVNKHKPALYNFIFFFSLAVLCKSAAALIAAPIFILTCSITPSKRSLLKTILAIAASCIPFIAFVSYRELEAPGYINIILENDFIGRFANPIEGHSGEWYYYLVNLIDFRFNYFIYLLPIALFFGLIGKSKTWRYYSIFFIAYLIGISIVQTRIHWYDMPLLPLASIVLVLGLYYLFERFKNNIFQTVFTLMTCTLLSFAVVDKFEFITKRKGLLLDQTHYELSDLLRNYRGQTQTKYIAAPYDAEFYFYAQCNPKINRGNLQQLDSNDIVFYGNRFKDSIPLLYNYTVLIARENAWKVKINGKK
jgi:4-amino-4-deoxy-L-arabinose transferase-like glycosyltransferase